MGIYLNIEGGKWDIIHLYFENYMDLMYDMLDM